MPFPGYALFRGQMSTVKSNIYFQENPGIVRPKTYQ